MSNLLQELVGQEVWFWTTAAPSDVGILEAVGNQWVRLTSTTYGLLLPLANLRLLKVIGGRMEAQAVSGELASSLVGRTVRISSKAANNTCEDTGKLEAFDDSWLRVRVKNDQLYFPVSSIVEMRLL